MKIGNSNDDLDSNVVSKSNVMFDLNGVATIVHLMGGHGVCVFMDNTYTIQLWGLSTVIPIINVIKIVNNGLSILAVFELSSI